MFIFSCSKVIGICLVDAMIRVSIFEGEMATDPLERALNMLASFSFISPLAPDQRGEQGEVQPGEQLLQRALDVWRGPSMVITGDDDPTVPTQVLSLPP